MSEPNQREEQSAEGVVRALYAKVGDKDFAGVLALLSDEVVFVQAESLPFGGRFAGHSGFTDMASRILAAWPGFAVEPIAFMSDGAERVVVLTQLRGHRLDMQMLKLWTVRNGRVRQYQPFYFDTAAAARTATITPTSDPKIGA